MMCLPGIKSVAPASRKRKFEDSDASGMALRAAEQTWAKRLKAAAREEDDAKDALSDLEYAQHSIASGGESIEEDIRKIKGLQTFQKKYGIQGTTKEAMKCLRSFFDRYPDVLLTIDRVGSSTGEGSRYFVVLDLASILEGAMASEKSEKDRATLLAGLFHLSQCLYPDTNAMRGGATLIMECGGVKWDDFKPDCILHLWRDLYCNFPFVLRDAWFYHTTDKGTELLTLFGLQTLSEETMQRIYLGCQMDVDGNAMNLKDLFSPSSKEEARSFFLRETERLLAARQESKEAFFL